MTRTTLILGAGASRPYGFPTAAELRQIILQKPTKRVADIIADLGAPKELAGNMAHAIRVRFDADHLTDLQNEFFLSQETSIDRFVQQSGGRHFENSARYALAQIMLQCEKSSYLNRDWYGILRDALLQRGPDGIPAERLQIVTFNYDRSLEFYLWKAIQHTFGVTDGAAFELLESLRIHHVYGSLGNLRRGAEGSVVVPWAGVTEQLVRDAADQLSLLRPLHKGLPTAVRQFIRASNFVCFLGFGFWKENFELVADCIASATQIYASNRGLTTRVSNEVTSRFPKIKWGDGLSAELCLHEWNILP